MHLSHLQLARPSVDAIDFESADRLRNGGGRSSDEFHSLVNEDAASFSKAFFLFAIRSPALTLMD